MVKSPLRYPGGKQRLAKDILPLFPSHIEYREPFFGGGSMFFANGNTNAWVNDINSDVVAFWLVVRDQPEKLCALIKRYMPDILKWKKLRNHVPRNELERAYKFLFYNRVNFSGFVGVNSSPIGGLGQEGTYKITARWNPEVLCVRIMQCAEKLQGVKITQEDFAQLVIAPGKDVLLYCDPPYYQKGGTLYTPKMDHERLAELLRITLHNFVLSYDNCTEIRELYRWANIHEITANHSVVNKGHRTELVITNI